MIRTLTRLRHVTGDPLLVRAGRKMVFTPHAQRIRSKTHSVLSDMRAVLNPVYRRGGDRCRALCRLGTFIVSRHGIVYGLVDDQLAERGGGCTGASPPSCRASAPRWGWCRPPACVILRRRG
ncbi:hypothetical protein ML025_002570 [Klebsiella quasipneumoniae]|nr:hypothetical protein [Klebsiella quasipneumoniae]